MTIAHFISNVSRLILNPLILLAFGLAFLYFVYGVFLFLSKDEADKSRKEAQDSILWGIVGMAIMFSVYGIIKFTLGTFGLTTSDVSGAAPYLKL